jgi:hypothetical protein
MRPPLLDLEDEDETEGDGEVEDCEEEELIPVFAPRLLLRMEEKMQQQEKREKGETGRRERTMKRQERKKQTADDFFCEQERKNKKEKKTSSVLSVTKDCCQQTKKHIKKHNCNDTTAERGKAVMTNKFYSHHPSLSSNSWREEEDTIAEKEGGRWLDCCRSARNGLIGPTDNILATNS